MTDLLDRPVRVRVPATSANLGPGFDTFGLALALHDDVEARVTAGGLSVEVTGEGADGVPRGRRHLVVRAADAAFDRLGARPAGFALRTTNRIPHGRGLGSSAAAICAGILAARGLVRDGAAALDTAAVLGLAAELEGHPDNVAACLYGGFTIAWTTDAGPRAVSLPPAPDVVPVAFVPATAMATTQARALLPPEIAHRDAAFTAGRAALLVEALTRRPDLLLDATEDRLHQPFRLPAMAGSAGLVARLRAAGVAAVVSGAGPSVLALCDGPSAGQVRVMAPPGWAVVGAGVDRAGATVMPAGPDAAPE